MTRTSICVSLVLLISVASAQGDAKRIVPGKQIGKLNIGDLMDDMKWLKKPSYGDAAAGHQWQTWEAKKPDPRNGKILNSLDVFSSINDSGKYQIRLIRSTSPTFQTKDPVRVGTTFDQIRQKYPKIAKVADYESPQFSAKVAVYDETKAGITFEFKLAKDGTVNRHEKCLSIWVHEPAVDALQQGSPTEYFIDKPNLREASKTRKQITP